MKKVFKKVIDVILVIASIIAGAFLLYSIVYMLLIYPTTIIAVAALYYIIDKVFK
ncbi:MAG: hypothetical protein ACOC2U_01065 [bacterium]